MMATAPTVNNAADVSASPNPQPASPVHDVGSEPPPVNGVASHDEIENKRITNIEDQVNSAEASASGGSDTEASRADKFKDGDKSHGRTGSSVKKPATFKAVSVNKTFLAAKATPASTTTKTNDTSKPSPSTPPPGSATLSASRPRLVAKTGSGARDSGPRLSGLNGGKPASAPDPNVVWNKNRPTPTPDPKKLTDEELKKYGIHVASRLDEDVTQGQSKWADLDDDDEDWAPDAITWTDGTKTTLPHTDEPAGPAASNISADAKDEEQEKTKSPTLSSTISPQPKPGGLASGKGLVLKGATAPEKPTLVAKPPATQQLTKSPWATLPPVEKASPALGSRGGPREPLSQRGVAAPGPLPLREIAADDFSRSTWRDGSSHGNRELYNSQSGRYEPVSGRRASWRSDQAKHPSVLQRPSPTDQPAEPSLAFQTHRTTQEGHLNRRRGSSNVSGGSGSFYQRGGKGSEDHMPPADLPGARRPSHAGPNESPVPPATGPGPGPYQTRSQNSQSGYPPGPSPGTSFAMPHPAGPPGPDVTPQPPAPQAMDDIEYQKRLMRERTELARKRRQEEEAAEEAAKRERIQKKLDAMGPAPKKKSEKNDDTQAEEPPKPTQIQRREEVEPPVNTQPYTTESPDADHAEPKVSQDARAPNNRPTAQTEPGLPSVPAPRRLSQGQEAKQPSLWGGPGGPGARTNRLVSWAPGSQAPIRNVWGSPNNDRGLGNGTFDPDLGRVPDSTVPPPQAGKGPSPIAPPNSSREPSQGRQPQPPAPIGSRPSRYGPPASDLASKWVSSVAENDKRMTAARLAERVERERQLAERGMTMEDVQPTIKDTWRPVQVAGDGTRRAMAPGDPSVAQPGGPWQSAADDLSRATPPKEGLAPSHAGVIGSGSGSILPQAGPGPSSQPRTSRFFPARDPRADSSSAQPSRAESPTLPPPTMEGHPAYEGNAIRPHVSLPKPQPVVKLPPVMSVPEPQPRANRPSPLSWATPTPYKDAARAPLQQQLPRADQTSQKHWQQKFNNLLSNEKTSNLKSMVVDPSSKSALDYTTNEDSATVSLPGRSHLVVSAVPKTATSKPMAEECFDEPEIGSLPLVKFPHKVPEAAWHPAEAPAKSLPKRFAVQASVADPFYFAAEAVSGGNALRIQLPGMNVAKTATIPFSSRRGRGSHGRSGARHRGGHRGGNRRDTSGAHEGGTSSNRSGRGRGGYRGKGSENWNRQSPTQPPLQA